MKKAFLFLAPGFEEIEALATVDILRRGGVDVKMISITDSCTVKGAHGIEVVADALYGDAEYSDAAALILPGGMPGATNLNDFDPLREQLLEQYRAGRIVAAICAAPLVLGGLGLLKGRRATCYPGFEERLIGAEATGEATETDGPVITGRGPGLASNCGLAILSAIKSEAVADEVAGGMLL